MKIKVCVPVTWTDVIQWLNSVSHLPTLQDYFKLVNMPTSGRGRRLMLKLLVVCAVIYVVFHVSVLSKVGLSKSKVSDERSSINDEPNQKRAPTSELTNVAMNDGDTDTSSNADVHRLDANSGLSARKAGDDSESKQSERKTTEDGGLLVRDPEEGKNVSSTFTTAIDAVKSKIALQAAIAELQGLIDRGLVVPRWNGEKEEPVVPGGPGKRIFERAIN